MARWHSRRWHWRCAANRYLAHGKVLRPREAEAFKLVYGLNGPALTLREAGNRMALSGVRVRQLHMMAQRRLRARRRAQLVPYRTTE